MVPPRPPTGPDAPRAGIDAYLVYRQGDIWRICHEGHAAGAWRRESDAVDYACRLARESAALGYPSVVISDLDPQNPLRFPSPPHRRRALAG